MTAAGRPETAIMNMEDLPDLDDCGRCLACGNEVDGADHWCPCAGYDNGSQAPHTGALGSECGCPLKDANAKGVRHATCCLHDEVGVTVCTCGASGGR